MTELIRGLKNLKSCSSGTVVTIGNFDGVHRGHQALLTHLQEKASQLNLPSVVILFEPQPAEFFTAKKIPRLMKWREKFEMLRRKGIDKVVLLRFDAELATKTADDFVTEILISKLHARAIIIGDDFHFGKERRGDFHFLKKIGLQKGFAVEATPSILLDNERVSSTRIRNALDQADQALAERLLGRPYTMKGKVVHGDKRGRQLGFPTININLHRTMTPVKGIYAVYLQLENSHKLPGVANVGTRPAVGWTRCLLEVHVFNFNKEMYGHSVTVEFCYKLRDEAYFATLELLREQISKDAEDAKKYFSKQRLL